ncbi:MAG: hypothetical protein IK085_02770, partial [Clostridia bacterium]|nr:hypothetical protein [Clostridia bacterium]
MKNGKKSKKGAIIGGAIGIFIVMLGISGARNSSKNSSDYENTTVVERIVIDSNETTEAVFSETIAETTTEKPTTTTTTKLTTTEKPTTTAKPTTTERKTTATSTTESEHTYILNNNSMKFHDPA